MLTRYWHWALTAVNVKITVFGNGTSCTLVDWVWMFLGGSCFLYLQVRYEPKREGCRWYRKRKKRGSGKYAGFHKVAEPSVLAFSVTNHLAPLGQRECWRSVLDTRLQIRYCIMFMWFLKVMYKEVWLVRMKGAYHCCTKMCWGGENAYRNNQKSTTWLCMPEN
jgi:hypothetical protein